MSVSGFGLSGLRLRHQKFWLCENLLLCAPRLRRVAYGRKFFTRVSNWEHSRACGPQVPPIFIFFCKFTSLRSVNLAKNSDFSALRASKSSGSAYTQANSRWHEPPSVATSGDLRPQNCSAVGPRHVSGLWALCFSSKFANFCGPAALEIFKLAAPRLEARLGRSYIQTFLLKLSNDVIYSLRVIYRYLINCDKILGTASLQIFAK